MQNALGDCFAATSGGKGSRARAASANAADHSQSPHHRLRALHAIDVFALPKANPNISRLNPPIVCWSAIQVPKHATNLHLAMLEQSANCKRIYSPKMCTPPRNFAAPHQLMRVSTGRMSRRSQTRSEPVGEETAAALARGRRCQR